LIFTRDLRSSAIVQPVTDSPSPHLAAIAEIVVPVLHSVYDANAGRHDPLLGDDAVTFGCTVYRNSWFQIEQAFNDQEGWSTGRPDGSLTVSNGDVRLHFYRCGNDENTDLEQFRFDEDPASATKRSIAASNSNQLTLALFDEESPDSTVVPADQRLRELVVVHAGNPDDGCCGVWLGAPVTVEAVSSPWAWISPLWLIERSESSSAGNDAAQHVPHSELPEPDLDIRPIDEADESSAGEV
jgi:hypothetical protein